MEPVPRLSRLGLPPKEAANGRGSKGSTTSKGIQKKKEQDSQIHRVSMGRLDVYLPTDP